MGHDVKLIDKFVFGVYKFFSKHFVSFKIFSSGALIGILTPCKLQFTQ